MKLTLIVSLLLLPLAFLIGQTSGDADISERFFVNSAMLGNMPHQNPVKINTLKRVPQEYPTIQSAIDAAEDSDTVLVD
ncbi:MAG: hypothetical protein KDF65_16765, partial [Anaerolineae bacterium]|nr:hypothetical protein [Anaerolineae bacterium]